MVLDGLGSLWGTYVIEKKSNALCIVVHDSVDGVRLSTLNRYYKEGGRVRGHLLEPKYFYKVNALFIQGMDEIRFKFGGEYRVEVIEPDDKGGYLVTLSDEYRKEKKISLDRLASMNFKII